MKINQKSAQWIIALSVIAMAGLILFGITGLRTIIAIAFLFIVPMYLLLRRTSLDLDEKIFFSLFAGLGLFPLAVWYVNRILPSFRLSIFATLLLIAALSFFWPKISEKISILGKKKQQQPQKQEE